MLVDYVAPYKGVFPDDPEIADFVERVEKAVIDPDETGKLGKVALHQAGPNSEFGKLNGQ